MRTVDLIVFDLDGTLIASGGDLAQSVNYTLETLGMEMLKEDIIIGYVGDGVKKLIERSIGADNMDRYETALATFWDYYGEHLLDTTILYDGVVDVLDYFRDKRKAVITNKMHEFTLTIVKRLGIAHYFDSIIGMDHSPYQKPDPRIMIPLLDEYGISSDRSVVVGDGVSDILLAQNIKAVSCAHVNGLGAREKLLSLKPDIIYENIKELCEYFS